MKVGASAGPEHVDDMKQTLPTEGDITCTIQDPTPHIQQMVGDNLSSAFQTISPSPHALAATMPPPSSGITQRLVACSTCGSTTHQTISDARVSHMAPCAYCGDDYHSGGDCPEMRGVLSHKGHTMIYCFRRHQIRSQCDDGPCEELLKLKKILKRFHGNIMLEITAAEADATHAQLRNMLRDMQIEEPLQVRPALLHL